jgi:hypothetical protein
MYLKNSKKILRTKQWSEGAFTTPNKMVGPWNVYENLQNFIE